MEKGIKSGTVNFPVKMPEKYSGYLIQTVCKATDENPAFVKLVAVAFENQLRQMDNLTAQARLIKEIPEVATAYGARHEPGNRVVTEAIKFILSKFGFLALDEIREAYRQWSADEIKAPGAETFGGEFNVNQLGKILSAYSIRRNEIKNALLKSRAVIQEKMEQIQRKEKAQEEFEKNFPKLIEHGKKYFKSWKEVPDWWYKSLIDRCLLTFEKGEQFDIMARAEDLAKEEIETATKENKEERLTGIISKIRIPDFETLVKSIARKISVFEKVLN